MAGLLAGLTGGFLMTRRLPVLSIPGIAGELLAVGAFIYLVVFQAVPIIPAGLPILGSLLGSLLGFTLRFRELRR